MKHIAAFLLFISITGVKASLFLDEIEIRTGTNGNLAAVGELEGTGTNGALLSD